MIIKALLVFSREEYLIKCSHLNTGQKELKKASFDASVWIIAKFAAFFFVQKATIAVVMVEKYRVSMILHFCCVYRKRKWNSTKIQSKGGKIQFSHKFDKHKETILFKQRWVFWEN